MSEIADQIKTITEHLEPACAATESAIRLLLEIAPEGHVAMAARIQALAANDVVKTARAVPALMREIEALEGFLSLALPYLVALGDVHIAGSGMLDWFTKERLEEAGELAMVCGAMLDPQSLND